MDASAADVVAGRATASASSSGGGGSGPGPAPAESFSSCASFKTPGCKLNGNGLQGFAGTILVSEAHVPLPGTELLAAQHSSGLLGGARPQDRQLRRRAGQLHVSID